MVDYGLLSNRHSRSLLGVERDQTVEGEIAPQITGMPAALSAHGVKG
jgi:hypothetical protein